MNLSKKRKITAFVTVAITVVAIVTAACVLTAPNWGQSADTYNNVESAPPVRTAIGDSTLKINPAVYSASNTNVVFMDVYKADSDVGWAKILYPKKIYLDKSEDLEDAKYYVAYNTYAQSNSGNLDRINIFDNVFGYFGDSDKPAEDSQLATMVRMFENYKAVDKQIISGSGTLTSNVAAGFNKSTKRNTLIQIEKRDETNAVIVTLGGTVKTDYQTGGTIDTFIHGSYDDEVNGGFPLGYTRWRRKVVNTWADLYCQDYWGDWHYQKLNGNNGFGAFIGGTYNGITVPSIDSPNYLTSPSVGIYIYDKSDLYAAIKKFESTSALLTKLNGNSNINTRATEWLNTTVKDAKNALQRAKDAFAQREIEQDAIDAATAELNQYIFEFDDVTVTDQTAAYNYKAESLVNAADIKSMSGWSRYDSKFYDVKYYDSGSNEVSEIKNAGTYTVKVAPKTEVTDTDTLEGYTLSWKFRWADNQGNEYRPIGTIRVNKIDLRVTGINDVERVFKNSAYTITPETETQSGTVNYNGSGTASGGNNNANLPNLYEGNTAKVEFSLDNATWGNANLSLTDVGVTTVYYKASSDTNYNPAYGSFTVEIVKATLTLNFAGNITQTYGDAKLDSAGILGDSALTVTCTADATDAPNWANTLISQIFTLRVASSGTSYNGAEYLSVGHYNIRATVNDSWQDRVNTTVACNNADDVYIVNAKTVTLTWSDTQCYYDAGAHISVASVAASQLAAVDQANGVSITPTVSLAAGGSAINAGNYPVTVDLNSDNYVCSQSDVTAGALTISPRPITVTLADRERTYAENGNVKTTWQNYQNAFKVEADGVSGVYSATTTANDGSDALVDEAYDVFRVTVSATAADYTSGAGAEPIYDGAPDDRYFKANTTGYVLSVTGCNDNYAVSGVSAKLVINPATIDYTTPTLASKSYNAQEQTVKIEDTAVKAELSGYENANFDTLLANGDVKVEYKITAPTATADYTADLKLKNVASYTISYRISAPNHTTKTGTLTTQITKRNVYIDVAPVTRTYGEAILSSDDLKAQLPIKFYKDAAKSEEITYASELSFNILGGDGSDSDDVITSAREAQVIRTATAGVYGGYNIDYIENSVSNNYTVYYTQRNGEASNVGAYVVTPKQLNLIWEQSGDGWGADGKTFTFNGSSLAIAIQINTADIVPGDTFVPITEPTWKKDGAVVAASTVKNAGSYLADIVMLQNERNRNNYDVVNPTETFSIVAREVIVKIMNLKATFGHANAVPIGTALPQALSEDASSGALWDYDGGEANKFVGEDYKQFRLHSVARHPQAGEKYVGAGDYPIVMEAINAESQANKNYTVTLNKDNIEGENGWNATFTIEKASINYTGRRFDIDFDNGLKADSDEVNYITKAQIENQIAIEADVSLDEFTIEMTDLLKGQVVADGQTDIYDNLLFGDVAGIDSMLSSNKDRTDTEITSQADCGKYFVYIRITHSKDYGDGVVTQNYETYTARIEVNIQSGWFSIVLSGSIKADYGEPTDNSLTIFNKLSGNDGTNVSKIGQLVVAEGENNMSQENAMNLLKQYVENGDIEFYVGTGDTLTDLESNRPFGKYSIFVRVKNSSIAHQYFRFLDKDGKSGPSRTPTNVGAYEVTKRLIQMDWQGTEETYGEHNANSAFHKYKISNAMTGDNVRAYVTFYIKNSDGSLTEIADGDHSKMRDVGTYLARVTGITDTDNYWFPTEESDGYWLETELEIKPRTIAITLQDRSELSYGSPYAKKDTINTYLNAGVTGITRYVVTAGKFSAEKNFPYDDTIADILTFELGSYTALGAGLEYLHADDYTITYQSLNNPNYDLTVTDAKLTINKAAATNVGYTQYTDRSSKYNGADVSLIKENIQNRITLIGDGSAKLHAYENIQVTIKFHDEADAAFAAGKTVKNAGVYYFDIKVVAPDHEARVFSNLVYTVEQAEVKISMKANAKAKAYGDTLADMLAGETGMTTFNEWLKKYCNIKLTYTGTIAGIDNDFEFIVIDKNTDLEGVVTPLDPDVRRDVGKYDVYLDVAQLNGNYDYEFVGDCNVDAYVISARNADVIWRAGSANTADTVTSGDYKPQYTASAIALSAWVTDIDSQEYQLNVTGRNTNVGTGTATVSVDTETTGNKWMKNYNFVGASFNYEIVKRNATVTIKDAAVTFGANNAKLNSWKNVQGASGNITVDGATKLEQFITFNVKTTSAKEYLDAASYTLEGSCSSGNYNVTWNNGTLTVNKATVTNNEEKTYSQPYNGDVFVADIEKLVKDGNYYTFAGGMTWADANVNYNKADATIEGLGTKNVDYTVTLANHNTIYGTYTITVTQAVIRLKVVGNASSEYGQNLLGSDELFKIVEVAEEGTTLKDVKIDAVKKVVELKVDVADGDYKDSRAKSKSYKLAIVWKDESDKGLYDIKFATSANPTGSYAVTPKEISITWNYNATTKYIYNGDDYQVTASFSGVIGNDQVGVASYTGSTQETNAGTYKATVSGLNGDDSGNYTLGASSELTWTIYAKEINVDWTARSFTYDGQIKNLAGMTVARSGDLVGSDTCAIDVVATDEDKVYAGKHTATAVAKNKNYVVKATTANFEFEIKKAQVTIEWDENTLTLTYNGAEQAPKADIKSGLVTNVLTGKADECKIVVSGAERDVKADGKYTATATLDNPNYTVAASDATAEFSIAPKAVAFTWDESTLTLTYTGEAQAPKAKAVGAVEGDVVEFEYEGMQVNATPQGQKYTAKVKAVKGNNYILDADNIAEADMSTDFVINKGVNGFAEEGFLLPATLSKLPWTDGQNPDVKWGTATVKYYSDEELTQEVDINSAGEGKYWVVVRVAETDNYFEFTQVFEVQVEGGLEIIIVALGAVVSVLLIVGAAIVVVSTNKKKKSQGDAQ